MTEHYSIMGNMISLNLQLVWRETHFEGPIDGIVMVSGRT
jgi:hypothetical protein